MDHRYLEIIATICLGHRRLSAISAYRMGGFRPFRLINSSAEPLGSLLAYRRGGAIIQVSVDQRHPTSLESSARSIILLCSLCGFLL
jgi:hypothetical protein